jgi:uncharacterized protein (DUF58 family)
MARVHDVARGKIWAARLLTTDFCPWANRFVYWLKEPVGWFVLAAACSVIVGIYLAPIGWTLAASLVSAIAVGIVWPAIAVRAVSCRISPSRPKIHEGDLCELQLIARNRLPLPVWGLAVEGFLDRRCDREDEERVPTVALAFVRALATCTYRFAIRPDLRGCYPAGDAVLTCSFPFGIWTARRRLTGLPTVTVWPRVYPIMGQSAMTGRRATETGNGHRSGRAGDFLGVRNYRHGDCLRQVNWVATARSGDLIVTERSGPQCSDVEVIIDLRPALDRDHFSDRIRVAASLLANLHQSAVSLRVRIGQRCLCVRGGRPGFVQMMDALAEIPWDGAKDHRFPRQSDRRAAITISSNPRGDIAVRISDPSLSKRMENGHTHRLISSQQGLASQLRAFWTEANDAHFFA